MGDISSTEKKLHWHLQGNWAPVEEELYESNLEVKGKIPEDDHGPEENHEIREQKNMQEHTQKTNI